jgi:hypothetical protein
MREWIAGARAGSKEEKKRIGRVCHGRPIIVALI